MQKVYSRILELISILLMIGIFFILIRFIPHQTNILLKIYPNFLKYSSTWLKIIWVEALPIFYCGFRCLSLYENIYNDEIFTSKNLKIFSNIKKALILNILLIIAFNIFSHFFLIQHKYLILLHLVYVLILLIVYILISLGFLLLNKAVNLQTDSDLTI